MSSINAAQRTETARLSLGELRTDDLIAERFRIRRILGIGGMGMVYQAHDEKLDVPVALKLLLPSFAVREDAFARFRRELLLARQVASPHVVRIHDFVAHDGRWLISMDYIDGGSLRNFLDERGALPVELAVTIARQIALGLAAAHAQGIVHRDLKPGNVLVDSEQRVYVTDFGVARSVGVTGLTASGAIIGTPEYLSPEQARGVPLDARSDLYALGLMLYEMIAGRLPYELGTPAEMLAQRIVMTAPSLSKRVAHTPRWLDRLVAQLLALDPARRPASAEIVAQALAAGRTPWQWPRARTLAIAAAALLATAGGAWTALNLERIAPQLAAALPAPRLDVLLLPIQSNDPTLARALDELVIGDLLAAGIDAASADQVKRTLTLLGFSADEALAHAPRLQSALPSRALIGIDLNIDAERMDLVVTRHGNRPERIERTGLTASSFPLALRDALREFGFDGATATWPSDPIALRAYGQALSAQPDEPQLDKVLGTHPTFAALWYERLVLAQRHGKRGDLEKLASDAIATLASVRSRDAERVRALAQQIGGDPAGAIARVSAALAIASADAALRLALGELLDETAQHELAAVEYDTILRRDPNDASALLARGRNALRLGDAQLAIDQYLGKALQLHTRLDDGLGRADTLTALGVAYERLGQLTPAGEHFAQAASLREALGDLRGAASSLRNLGYGHGIQGRFDAAQSAFAKARALLAQLDDKAALADLANDEGLIAEEAGDFSAAAERYREVLDLRRALGDHYGSAEAELNLGFVLLHSGQYEAARVHLAEAERIYLSSDDAPGQVRSAQKLAMLDLIDGDFERALARLRAALQQSEALQLVEEEAVSLAELGDVLRHRGELGAALEALDRARALFVDRGDQRGVAEADLRRAQVHLAAESTAPAQATLASLIAAPPASIEQRAALDLIRAEIALVEGQPAGEHLANARKFAAQSASATLAFAADVLAARIDLASGNLNAVRAAVAALRGRGGTLGAWELAILEAALGEPATLDAPPTWPGTLRWHRARAASSPVEVANAGARLAALRSSLERP